MNNDKPVTMCIPVEWRDPEIEALAESLGIPSREDVCASCNRGIVVSTKGAKVIDNQLIVEDLKPDTILMCGFCMSDRSYAEGDYERGMHFTHIMSVLEEKHRARIE